MHRLRLLLIMLCSGYLAAERVTPRRPLTNLTPMKAILLCLALALVTALSGCQTFDEGSANDGELLFLE